MFFNLILYFGRFHSKSTHISCEYTTVDFVPTAYLDLDLNFKQYTYIYIYFFLYIYFMQLFIVDGTIFKKSLIHNRLG